MNFSGYSWFIFCCLSFFACKQNESSSGKKQNIIVSQEEKVDLIQQLIDSTMPFIEVQLKEKGEFFPIGTVLTTKDKIVHVAAYYGDEHPPSDSLIKYLKTRLKTDSSNNKAISLFFDVSAIDPKTKIKSNAIAVFSETKVDNSAYTIYYPYSLQNKVLTFSAPWKSMSEKQIFTKN